MGSATCITAGGVSSPGGNPVTEVPGLSTRSPPVIVVPGVGVLVTVEPARTLKFPAVSNATGGGPEHAAAAVVNIQLKSAASVLPNVSAAPVVIVAVYVVLTASPGDRGVKVAVSVAGSYLTPPVTLPPLELKVNVEVLIVVGFIALLNTAVTTVLGQIPEEPLGGSTDVDTTVGGVRGPPGFPAFLSGSPHPAITRARKNARIQI